MQPRSKLPLEQLALALVGGLVLTSLVVLAPAVATRLRPAPPAPAPAGSAEPTAPPAAVLLPEELDRDLQGVMILVNDRSFGTAFQIDKKGGFLTAASLLTGSQPLRLVDNTGGSHPVRVVGIDQARGLAEIRADADGVPLALGASESVRPDDPLLLLASAKVVNLRSATPATVTAAGPARIALLADDLPGEIGGPLVGPGGTVLAVFIAHGSALPIAAAQADMAAWRGLPGTLAPLASLPLDLVLRGTGDATAPAAGTVLQAVTPNRGSSSQATLVTLQGSGFSAGPALSVRFLPLAGQTGAFQGASPTVTSSSVVTVKVPAGSPAQDYVVEFTNGDGTVAAFHAAFTITP